MHRLSLCYKNIGTNGMVFELKMFRILINPHFSGKFSLTGNFGFRQGLVSKGGKLKANLCPIWRLLKAFRSM
jgi:hypothetical protein